MKKGVIWQVLNLEASEAVFPKAVQLRVKAASQIGAMASVYPAKLWPRAVVTETITCPGAICIHAALCSLSRDFNLFPR